MSAPAPDHPHRVMLGNRRFLLVVEGALQPGGLCKARAEVHQRVPGGTKLLAVFTTEAPIASDAFEEVVSWASEFIGARCTLEGDAPGLRSLDDTLTLFRGRGLAHIDYPGYPGGAG